MLLEQAKEQLATARNVDEWNTIRRQLKSQCPITTINQIDSSGYIGKVRANNNWPKKERR